jgi:DNA-directed RNA polymerase specialized sigma24 family protein
MCDKTSQLTTLRRAIRRREMEELITSDPISNLIRHAALRLSKSSGFCSSDRPDLEQEFRLHLLRKALLYDSSRASPITFVNRIIANKAKSMQRAARARSRDCRRRVSLEESVCDDDGVSVSLAQTIDETAGRRHTGQRRRSEGELTQLKLDIENVNKELPPAARDIAALISHVPIFAAGQVVGISRRQAAKHLATLRKCYEKHGLAI